MSDVLEILRLCSTEGIVFHPLGKRLRPEKTNGHVSRELKSLVEKESEEIREFFSEAFDWPNDLETETIQHTEPA